MLIWSTFSAMARHLPDAAISNHEYFIRLAQQVTEILSRITREGPVFSIDLRLRPQGGGGELAISLSNALHYYGFTAQDWERQAPHQSAPFGGRRGAFS